MNVVDTIREKVFRLPPKAQKEVLEIVEQLEERYRTSEGPAGSSGNKEHPLSQIAKVQLGGLPPDFAGNHDLYCHGKQED